MSFPTVAQFSGGSPAANTTTHTVTFPGGAPTTGDLILVLFAFDDNPTSSMTGYTPLANGPGASSACRLMVMYRISDGTEGTTDNAATNVNQGSAWQCYIIRDYTGVPECTTIATGTSGAMDSASLAPSWGAKDTLWITAAARDGNNTTTSYPSNYTDGRVDRWANAEGASISSARRNLNASSEDPGAFVNPSDQWGAVTIAIQGTGSDVAAIANFYPVVIA